jgi:hypothetical protein
VDGWRQVVGGSSSALPLLSLNVASTKQHEAGSISGAARTCCMECTSDGAM